jgi:hypothetical protein
MIKNYLTLLLLFFIVVKCTSQDLQIRGLLINETNEPAYFTEIKLISGIDTLCKDTDFEGKFEFNNLSTGQFFIIIDEIGYHRKDTTFELSDDIEDIEIRLKNDTSYFGYSLTEFAYNAKRAAKDTSKNNITLLLPGGEALSFITDEDKLFESKFRITFLSRGCIRMHQDNELMYNKVMFKYLNGKYGKEWGKTIRKDVIGLKK